MTQTMQEEGTVAWRGKAAGTKDRPMDQGEGVGVGVPLIDPFLRAWHHRGLLQTNNARVL